jgi:hypothetical protein
MRALALIVAEKKLKVASDETRRRFHEDKARYLDSDDPRETINNVG